MVSEGEGRREAWRNVSSNSVLKNTIIHLGVLQSARPCHPGAPRRGSQDPVVLGRCRRDRGRLGTWEDGSGQQPGERTGGEKGRKDL